MSSVAITGVGLVSGLGAGVDAFWDGLRHGRRALAVRLPVGSDGASRRERMVALAVREALAGAGISQLPRPALVVLVGQAPSVRAAVAAGDLDALTCALPPSPAIGVRDRTVFLSHACASAGFGVAYARTLLRAGVVRSALVVGAAVASEDLHASMDVVRALSAQPAPRPFNPARDGTVLGEGAGALLLEPLEALRARGLDGALVVRGIAQRVGGSGMASIGREAAAACVAGALREAGAERVEYVHAHAAGTRGGDAEELSVLDQVGAERGWRNVPVSSHKGAIGHLLHASMFAGVAAAGCTLRTGIAPGTVGLGAAREDGCLRLLAVPERLQRPPRAVLVNGFGFAGNHVALVLGSCGY